MSSALEEPPIYHMIVSPLFFDQLGLYDKICTRIINLILFNKKFWKKMKMQRIFQSFSFGK